MRLGFALPHVGPVATRENIRNVAVEAERMDYDSLWTLDRLVNTTRPRTPYPATPDGKLNWQYDTVFEHLSVLTYAAALTERLRLGVSVINLPFYQPVLLAKRLATLDQLSNGRIDVGLGVGWSEDEAIATSTDFHVRGRQTEEYIRALKAMWGPDPVEFDGEWVRVEPANFAPKPVQQPHPPLLIGAFAPAALRRAGRMGDGYTICCAPLDDIFAMREVVREAADAAGRDGASLPMVVRCLVYLKDRPVPADERPVGTGTFEQIREDALRMRDAGVDEIFFDLSFEDSNDSSEALMGYLERFRGILDEP